MSEPLASPVTAAAAASRMLSHAASLFANAAIARRNALIKQLQLQAHVFEMAPASSGTSEAKSDAAICAGLGSRGVKALVRGAHKDRQVMDGIANVAMMSSIHSLAAQLRKETVRVVEAVKLVRATRREETEVQHAGSGETGDSGSGGTTAPSSAGSPAPARVASSSGSTVGSNCSSVLSSYEAYLVQMLHDTDFISSAPGLVRVTTVHSHKWHAHPISHSTHTHTHTHTQSKLGMRLNVLAMRGMLFSHFPAV
ncbi:hypothetical protein EON66_06640 [archaeon]|nr:MAG: hypothetical protein EON66_06640 [archaeon]